eukprot:NODE_385_length_8329_cov_0.434386.p6 type:complete len:119 gc:universal NODE_385_length_8329_cov_0.434386:3179-2823(-)
MIKESTKLEMKYQQQFVYFQGAFSEGARYYNKFLRYGATIVNWCNGRGITPKGFCKVASAICEYLDEQGIQSATFSGKRPEDKTIAFTTIAEDGGWEVDLVRDVYNQIFDANGTQVFN